MLYENPELVNFQPQLTVNQYLNNGNTILSSAQVQQISYLDNSKVALIENIMRLKYGIKKMYYQTEEDVQASAFTVFMMHDYTWTTKYATNQFVYNPLHMIDLEETGTDTHSGTDTTTASQDNTGTQGTSGTSSKSNTGTQTTRDLSERDNTGTQTIADTGTTTRTDDTNSATSKRSYDSNIMTETDSVADTGTVETEIDTERTRTDNLSEDIDATRTRTDNLTETGTESSTRTDNLHQASETTLEHGHIIEFERTKKGHDSKSAMELIAEQREIAEYNFFEMVADELTDFLTLNDYDFTNQYYIDNPN